MGMVLGISFIEAPLKFRAPGITIELGLGIGQIVFRALNACECVLAAIVAIATLASMGEGLGSPLLLSAVIVLVVQLAIVRPLLRRRSRHVLEHGAGASRSLQHLWYVALEALKVILLAAGCIVTLAGFAGA